MEHSGQRNGNWTRDCGCVLRAWADEMMIEHGWSCVRDVDSLKLQKWFYNKTRTLKVSAGVSIFKVSKWCGHRVDVCEEHLIPADKEIEVGLERRAPAPEVAAPEVAAHRALTWEETHELVWKMPFTKAARELGITDTGLRKKCLRLRCRCRLRTIGRRHRIGARS